MDTNLMYFLMILVAASSIYEHFLGWQGPEYLLSYLQPTVFKIRKSYNASADRILGAPFADEKAIVTKTDSESKCIYFRRWVPFVTINNGSLGYYYNRVYTTEILIGEMALKDCGGRTEAVIRCKLPFTGTFPIPVFLIYAFLTHFDFSAMDSAAKLLSKSWIPAAILILYAVAYPIEKNHFLDALSIMDRVLLAQGIERE